MLSALGLQAFGMLGFTVKCSFFFHVFAKVHNVVESVVLAEHFAQRGTAADSIKNMVHARPVDRRGTAAAGVRSSEPKQPP